MNPRTAFIALAAVACTSAQTPAVATQASPVTSTEAITESDVRRILSTLAADSMEGRYTGSRGANKAAAFIVRELESLGVKPAGDDGTFLQKVPFASITSTTRGPTLKLLDSIGALNSVPEPARVIGYNIIGVMPGSDPALKNEIVAFAAHYDGVGIGKAVNGDSIYNAADDDASGVTAILQIARAFSKSSPPKRTILFMLTTGEEEGILGTRWYVNHPSYPLSSMVAEMEVEMAGRPDSLAGGRGKLWMTGFERSTMGSMLKAAGIPIVPDPYPQFKFFERSDNIVFALKGIPAHTLSSYNLHQDYHAPSDEISTIDFEHLTQISRAAYQAARLLTDGPAPKWNPGGQPQPR
ncbi:MAG TPA: M28 family peptidase [Gemmatimonadaceae bacterium]